MRLLPTSIQINKINSRSYIWAWHKDLNWQTFWLICSLTSDLISPVSPEKRARKPCCLLLITSISCNVTVWTTSCIYRYLAGLTNSNPLHFYTVIITITQEIMQEWLVVLTVYSFEKKRSKFLPFVSGVPLLDTERTWSEVPLRRNL